MIKSVFYSIESFKEKYASYQKWYMLIVIFFLTIFGVQALLYIFTSIADLLPGYKTFLLIGIEIAIFLIVSKIHERTNPLKCPNCGKILAYKYGLEVINNSLCPHCKSCVINIEHI